MEWKHKDFSHVYDYRMIEARLLSLKTARQTGDIHAIIGALRSGLLRNLGGIGDKRLFDVMYTGTKSLVEDYLDEVRLCLDIIYQNDFTVACIKVGIYIETKG